MVRSTQSIRSAWLAISSRPIFVPSRNGGNRRYRLAETPDRIAAVYGSPTVIEPLALARPPFLTVAPCPADAPVSISA